MRGQVAKRLSQAAYLRTRGHEGMVQNTKTGERFFLSYSKDNRALKRWWNSLSAPERMLLQKEAKDGKQVPEQVRP